MIVLGLTGSIGMGKTTAAGMLRRLGVPVFESDGEIHLLLAKGGRAVAPIAAAFPGVVPGVVQGGAVDRAALGRVVFNDAAALARLEAILHPMVREAQDRFLRHAAARRAAVVVLDIPLLFETGGDERCDAVIVVSAPGFVQAARVLARPGMDRDRLAGIVARQMSDAEKRRRADFVVPTGSGRNPTLRRLRDIVKVMHTRRPARWPPGVRGYRRPRFPRRARGIYA